MKVAILQPGYLPWLGFFDLMHRVDQFVIFDDVQYTVRDWRNRNRIKTQHGTLWLTVPVAAAAAREQAINGIMLAPGAQWQTSHRANLESAYRKAPFFDVVMNMLDRLYSESFDRLIDVTTCCIEAIRSYLGIQTPILLSSDLGGTGVRDERLLSLCKILGASSYLSGPAARAYLREDIFHLAGIDIEWHDYRHPFYRQLWTKPHGFISHLSVVDLLFNHGPDSLDILTGRLVIPNEHGIEVRNANILS